MLTPDTALFIIIILVLFIVSDFTDTHMSRRMGKQTICTGENKGADQLISAFVFAARIVRILFFLLNPKFQASSLLL